MLMHIIQELEDGFKPPQQLKTIKEKRTINPYFPLLNALTIKTVAGKGVLLAAANCNFSCRPLLCICVYMTMACVSVFT